MSMASWSRGAMMVHMAVGADATEGHKPHKPPQNLMIAKQMTANSSGSKFEPKELRPENIEYVSNNPVGSGSFGQFPRPLSK